MSDSQTAIEPLNPNVYLNHLPPSQAEQVEVSRNIMVAVLGVVNHIHFIRLRTADRLVYPRRPQFGIYLFTSWTI